MTDEHNQTTWIDEVIELAKKENIPIGSVEEGYKQGKVVRFALPDDPTKEAGIYLWYKKVECFQELADKIEDLRWFYRGPMLDDIGSFMEEILEKNIGYKRDINYDAFVKDVDTPEEAIEEVKLMMKRMPEIEEVLCDACDSIEQSLQDVIQVLSKDKSTPKDNEPKYLLRVRHKTPEWMKKIEKGQQDNSKELEKS